MGVLPPVETGAIDHTTFGGELVLLLLRPAITNQVFTICFWVRLEKEPAFSCLITQEGKDANWSFMTTSSEGADFL